MRIALLSTVVESVPPKMYGGTERVVNNLACGLQRLGHQVTVYAAGDSDIACDVRPVCREALRRSRNPIPASVLHLLEMEAAMSAIHEFDIVHSHIEHVAFPLLRRLSKPHVSTLHSRLDLPEVEALLEEYAELPLVALTESQRSFAPNANWVATIPHGICKERYTFGEGVGDYLLFLGRICPEKGPDQAIEIAKQAGMHLKIAAKVDAEFEQYFEQEIAGELSERIEYVGEVNEEEKIALLGDARALVFPIDWPEPFGLVMIEAMACGTPVVAYRAGSVPEIVVDGENGFIVDSVEQAAQMVGTVSRLDRKKIRTHFEEHYAVDTMVGAYARLYEEMLFSAGGIRALQLEAIPVSTASRGRTAVRANATSLGRQYRSARRQLVTGSDVK